jgi:hypothetical protein
VHQRGNDVLEHDAVWDPAAVAAQWMVGVEGGPVGQQGGDLHPRLVPAGMMTRQARTLLDH